MGRDVLQEKSQGSEDADGPARRLGEGSAGKDGTGMLGRKLLEFTEQGSNMFLERSPGLGIEALIWRGKAGERFLGPTIDLGEDEGDRAGWPRRSLEKGGDTGEQVALVFSVGSSLEKALGIDRDQKTIASGKKLQGIGQGIRAGIHPIVKPFAGHIGEEHMPGERMVLVFSAQGQMEEAGLAMVVLGGAGENSGVVSLPLKGLIAEVLEAAQGMASGKAIGKAVGEAVGELNIERGEEAGFTAVFFAGDGDKLGSGIEEEIGGFMASHGQAGPEAGWRGGRRGK